MRQATKLQLLPACIMGVFPRDGVRPLTNTGWNCWCLASLPSPGHDDTTNTSLAQIIWLKLKAFQSMTSS